MTDRSGRTNTPPLKPAIAPSSLSGSISMLMPRGGRPLVKASVTPALRNSCAAAIACSVSTLSCVTSVPSTSASSSLICRCSLIVSDPFPKMCWKRSSRRAGDRDLEISAFPAILFRPEDGETNNAIMRRFCDRQIAKIHADAGRDGWAVCRRHPVVGRPVDQRLLAKFQPQRPSRPNTVDFRSELPDDRRRRRRILDVAIHGLRRHVEHGTVPQRPQQLDVLGMRPYQRHGAAGGPTTEQFELRDVVAVPDLFRDQATRACRSL